MEKFDGIRAKTWAYLMDDDSEHKKLKKQKNNVIKRGLMIKNYIDYLFNDKIIVKSQRRFKSDYHNVYTEQINNIALSSNDDRDYKHLIKLQGIHAEQMLLKYAKMRCQVKYK